MDEHEYVTVLSDDKSRTLTVRLFIDTDRFRGFADDERCLAWGYWDTGALMHVQDTLHGKVLWPEKVIRARPEGSYDSATVYFVAAETGQIKIGIAQKPAERLRTLQIGSPVKLTILALCEGGVRQETAYHRQFAEHRLHGEWFAPHPDILAEIERLSPSRS